MSGLSSSVVRALSKGHGFDPRPGQLIFLSLIFTAIAGVSDLSLMFDTLDENLTLERGTIKTNIYIMQEH